MLGKMCFKEPERYKLFFGRGCNECGDPFNHEVYWSNLMFDADEDCPDFKQKYFDDPSGS